MTTFAHLSDLHFGAEDQIAISALEAFLVSRPELPLMITGDLTQDGRQSEFDTASRFFARLPNLRVIVPGNHDVPVYNLVLRTFAPWKRFMAAFNRPVDSQIQCGDVWICGQNSARRAGLSLDWSLGRLSRGQVSQACQLARRAPVQSLKVFALHHPMLAQGRGAAAAVIGGAAQIKQSLSAAGYDLILHGHGHLSRKAIDPDGSPGLLISAAGSATSRRLRGEAQSFDLLHWNDPDLVIETWQLDGSAFQPLPTRTWRRGADGWQSLETPK